MSPGSVHICHCILSPAATAPLSSATHYNYNQHRCHHWTPRGHARFLPYCILANPWDTLWRGSFHQPILQMQKLRLGQVKGRIRAKASVGLQTPSFCPSAWLLTTAGGVHTETCPPQRLLEHTGGGKYLLQSPQQSACKHTWAGHDPCACERPRPTRSHC